MKSLSFIMSIAALALYCISYFFNNKTKFLVFQLSGNAFLSFSYFFMGAYFIMASVIIGIGRGLICYIYEKNDKKVPVYMVLGLCLATVLSYIIINYVLLSGDASPWDILYLFASCIACTNFLLMLAVLDKNSS